ncbi:MAG: hypothetical protein K2P88_14205 [Chitinophagaceae bacterium]|nr:hypothetical protein [Chitinophagaceae bacterium]
MKRILFILLIILPGMLWAQNEPVKDSLVAVRATTSMLDTNRIKKHSPRMATIRSAIIPGWGQAYNKKYWKIPIVYAAIGVPAYLFFDNRKWYQRTRDAAKMLASDPIDTLNYRQRVDPKLWPFFTMNGGANSLLNYRNEYRKNMDYSVLFVLLMWGLNVVDATVDGHLKGFDISDDLSMKLKPTILQNSSSLGLSVVFTFGKNPSKTITSLR